MCELKKVTNYGKGRVTVDVHGYDTVRCYQINVDEMWVYRYRAQRGLPPPGVEQLEEDEEEDEEEIEVIDSTTPADEKQVKIEVEGEETEGEEKGKGDASMSGSSEHDDDASEMERPSSAYPIDIMSETRVTQMRTVKNGSGSAVTAVGSVGAAGLITGHKDGTVRLWIKGNQSANEEGIRLGRHDGEVASLVVVGRHAFTGSVDGSVRHWDAFRMRCEGVLPGHVEGVTSMCVADDSAASPEPTILAVAARDGAIRVWIVDREDYACLCIINCPETNTLISTMCFDPETPCLYATGMVTDRKGRESSVLICFSIAPFLRMHMLNPGPPNKPNLRRISAPPPEPDAEIEGLDEADKAKKKAAAKRRAKAAAAAPKKLDAKGQAKADKAAELRQEDRLAEVLHDCVDAGLLSVDDAEFTLDQVYEGKETPRGHLEVWEHKLAEYEKPLGDVEHLPEFDKDVLHSKEDILEEAAHKRAQTQSLLADRKEPDADGSGEDGETDSKAEGEELAAQFLWDEQAEEVEDVDCLTKVKRLMYRGDVLARPKSADLKQKQEEMLALSKQLGIDPRKAEAMGLIHKEEKVIQPKRGKTIDIVRTEIHPHKGQRLPFVAAGYRLLIPGCLYSYTIEVSNGGESFAWLCIEDPQEPFSEFVMCEPAGSNVRVAELRKTDGSGRMSFNVVWKVGVPPNGTKRLTVVVRALVRPVFTEKLEACHVLFRGHREITAMLWLETGPVLGFADGSIIMMGAYIPPKDDLSRIAWEEIAPKAVEFAKRLAAVPAGRSRLMRCKRCLWLLFCCWNPCTWRCFKRRLRAARVAPREPAYSAKVDPETLRGLRGGKGQGAYKNVDRRLLMGFKRSARLRDGNREENLNAGCPIQSMHYNPEDRELFYSVKDIVSSVDVTARMNPWASPAQVLPAEDYITDFAAVGSDIKGLLPVIGDDDLLVTSEDGTVRRLFLVKKEAGAIAKLWTKHVVSRLAGLEMWLDDKLGAMHQAGAKKEKDLALDLRSVAGKMYSVRNDGQVVLWAPDFHLAMRKRQIELPKHIPTKIKFTAVGTVSVVEKVQTDPTSNVVMLAKATKVIDQEHVILVVCESPLKMASEANDDDYYDYSDYSDYDYSGDDSDSDSSRVSIDVEGGEVHVTKAKDGDGADGEPAFDEVHQPADTIKLWNAKTLHEIPVELEPPHPRGKICCVTISSGYVVVGRDCGSLNSYHLEGEEGKEVLLPAQSFEGHSGQIDGLRTIGQFDGSDDEVFCSSVLLYSYALSLILVHEVKSAALIFKFDLSPGLDKRKMRDLSTIRLSHIDPRQQRNLDGSVPRPGSVQASRPTSAAPEEAVLDHVVSAIGRDIEIWSVQGNIKDLVNFTRAALDSEESENDDDDDDSTRPPTAKDDDDDGMFIDFAMTEVKKEEIVVKDVTGPPRPKSDMLHAHTYSGHAAPITCMEVRGHYAFSGCAQGAVRVWRCVAPWSCLLVLNAVEGAVSRLLVPDLSTVWVAYGGFIRSWDLRAVHADMAKQAVAQQAKLPGAEPDTAWAEDAAKPEPETTTEVFSSSTGASTTILPLGHDGIPPVQSLAAVPDLEMDGNKLHQSWKVYASCVDGSVYRLTPLTKEPIYQTSADAAAEKLRGSIMAVVVGLVECLQLIGVSFSANDAVWPPGLDAARSLFGAWLGGGISSYTAPDWAGSFWSALVVGGMFLGAMIAQISTNLLVREEFSWKFGGTTGGVVVVIHFACIALRVLDFLVGIVLFITLARPLITTFSCGGLGATEEEAAVCWGMGHLTACAIAAPSLYIYVLMSWRIQRAYGNCGLFASRSIADLLSSKRDNVHHSPVHHLINFPRYCDTSMYVRILATAATVFCATQTMALTVVCALCLVLFFTVLARPPFQVGCMNFFALGTTATAFTANAIMLRAAWNTKDLDNVMASLWQERLQTRFSSFSHPEALEAWSEGAWGSGAAPSALPRDQLCRTAAEEDDELVAALGSWLLLLMLVAPAGVKLAFDWLYYSLVQPNWHRLMVWNKFRLAMAHRRKLERLKHLKKGLGHW